MTLINCHIDFILGFIHYFLNDFLHVRHIKVYWSIFSCVHESRKGFSKRLKHIVAVKFHMGYEKITSFLLISNYQISESFTSLY